MAEELVALYDLDGTPTGRGVPRTVMRRDNLVHGVVAVLVRDSDGRVFLHRRTDSKDVFPGAHDAFAAGCIQFGETPLEAATREVGEELGVHGVELAPSLRLAYEDTSTRHVAFVYAVTYDAQLTLQEEEIASGEWITVEDLFDRLDNPTWPFVPDGRALLHRLRAEAVL